MVGKQGKSPVVRVFTFWLPMLTCTKLEVYWYAGSPEVGGGWGEPWFVPFAHFCGVNSDMTFCTLVLIYKGDGVPTQQARSVPLKEQCDVTHSYPRNERHGSPLQGHGRSPRLWSGGRSEG